MHLQQGESNQIHLVAISRKCVAWSWSLTRISHCWVGVLCCWLPVVTFNAFVLAESNLGPESMGRRDAHPYEEATQRQRDNRSHYPSRDPTDRRGHVGETGRRSEGSRASSSSTRHGVTFNIDGEYFSTADTQPADRRKSSHDETSHHTYNRPDRLTSTRPEDRESRDRAADRMWSTLNTLEFPVHQYRQSTDQSPPPKPHGKVEYYSQHLGRTGGVRSTDYAERMGSSSAALRSIVGPVSTSENTRHRPSGRDPIRQFTEERKQSADACDDHVRYAHRQYV